jgi:hypothetical protein
MAMKRLLRSCCHARTLVTAVLYLACTCEAYAADMYNGADLWITSIVIGNATYSAMLVTPGTIVSIQGGAPNGSQDSYDPATNQLTIPSVVYGANTYNNVVITVQTLVSIGSVSGADTYVGTTLSVAAVQVGTATYNSVAVTVGQVLGVAGGMPNAISDSYDASSSQLSIPAVQYAGKVYTNVTVTVSAAAVCPFANDLTATPPSAWAMPFFQSQPESASGTPATCNLLSGQGMGMTNVNLSWYPTQPFNNLIQWMGLGLEGSSSGSISGGTGVSILLFDACGVALQNYARANLANQGNVTSSSTCPTL